MNIAISCAEIEVADGAPLLLRPEKLVELSVKTACFDTFWGSLSSFSLPKPFNLRFFKILFRGLKGFTGDICARCWNFRQRGWWMIYHDRSLCSPLLDGKMEHGHNPLPYCGG